MKFTLLCLAFSVPLASCISDGKDADGDTSFIVSLQADNKDNKEFKHFCCGVFFTLDFVLTAASCVTNRQPQDLRIVAGTKTLSNKNQQIQLKVDKIFSKEPFGRNKVRNNIALLRIATVIPDTELHRVRKVDLASGIENNVEEGEKCKMFGWGQKDFDKVPTDILQEGSTYVKPLSTCKLLLPDVDQTNICTQDTFMELCYFDAGDPLISESGGYLLGIATENFKCNDYYDVYTRVQAHKKWIWEIIDSNKRNLAASLTKSKPLSIFTGTGIVVLMAIWLNS